MVVNWWCQLVVRVVCDVVMFQITDRIFMTEVMAPEWCERVLKASVYR